MVVAIQYCHSWLAGADGLFVAGGVLLLPVVGLLLLLPCDVAKRQHAAEKLQPDGENSSLSRACMASGR